MTIRILFTGLFLIILFSPCPALSRPLVLLENGENNILGELPENWRPMAPEELENFALPQAQINNPGRLVSGFRPQAATIDQDSYILVFLFEGDRVTQDQIEKMYSWYESNRKLVQDLMPEQIDTMNIENIEYLQNRWTLITQSRMQSKGKEYTGINGTLFLKEGYLNITCISSADHQQTFSDTYYDFIKTISVPEPLQYATGNTSRSPGNNTSFMQWAANNRERIAGVMLLLAVYSAVFWGKSKVDD
ncbi:MAG: hypothetical protein KAJ60_04045 [Desulfobulbaceae bacterium]|nr:hypothetical protein [Desulfobulbaceae bacterium]